MRQTKSDHGLIISRSGFEDSVYEEVRQDYHYLRLWSNEEILREVYRHYDSLSAQLKAQLPLQRTWTLVR